MDASNIALIFPGQGSQAPGMGRELAEASTLAREIFDQADHILGRSISRLCFEGSEEELRRTSNTQPALYTVSAAALAVLRSEGIEASMAAGHSLGEYSALHAAGALDFATGLRLVEARGRAMEEAASSRAGAMAAIMGLAEEKVVAACAEATEDDSVVVAANWNSPQQVVLSGDPEAVQRAIERAKAHGARRSIVLNVGGAFHSPLMAEAAEALRDPLDQAEIKAPGLRFVANVSADFVSDPDLIRQSLFDQITSCVRWSETIGKMASSGAQIFIEVGSGKVLTGLLRRIDKSLSGQCFSSMGDINQLRETLG